MKLISTILLMISVGCNLLFIFLLLEFMIYTESKTVYDIDLVRKQVYDNIGYYYRRGCMTGTDYPPEYRESPIGFNTNSPTNWCNEQIKFLEEDILRDQYNVGRKFK